MGSKPKWPSMSIAAFTMGQQLLTGYASHGSETTAQTAMLQRGCAAGSE